MARAKLTSKDVIFKLQQPRFKMKLRFVFKAMHFICAVICFCYFKNPRFGRGGSA